MQFPADFAGIGESLPQKATTVKKLYFIYVLRFPGRRACSKPSFTRQKPIRRHGDRNNGIRLCPITPTGTASN